MKRAGNLYQKIYEPENLELAARIAQKGKRRQYGVRKFNKDPQRYLSEVHELFHSRSYRTSAYKKFTVYEPKERLVYSLPFTPDRIAHHAVMNQVEKIFVDSFTADTYSCIKGRGIHRAVRNMKKALRDEAGTQYCLKLDIRKFYDSIDHRILKSLLRRKFKDADLLSFFDEVIDSAPGVPIGNYLSQYFANFYLSGLDHAIKEQHGIKYYFRYCDDIVILAHEKQTLHEVLHWIIQYLEKNLRLTIKQNYQVFPVASRGIDFVGYVFFHTHTRLRKSIKQSFARAMARKNVSRSTVASYWSWAKHADTSRLCKKLINQAA